MLCVNTKCYVFMFTIIIIKIRLKFPEIRELIQKRNLSTTALYVTLDNLKIFETIKTHLCLNCSANNIKLIRKQQLQQRL